MNHSIIGPSIFDTFKLKETLLLNDAGEWGHEPDNNAIGVLRSTNFSNQGYLLTEDIAYRTLSELKKNDKMLKTGDIIIERSGGSNTQPVGRVGFIDKSINEKGFAFANFIQRIRVDEEIFDPKFVYYCLQQMYEMGITSSMQFQTTGIRNLDYKYYLKSKLPRPLVDEQKIIAEILFKVDEAIASVGFCIKASEILKKSLMQNLLTGKLKPDGTWRGEDEFYIDEKFGKVPKGWEVKYVGDKSLCNINPNYEFVKGKIYDFIPMDAINDGFQGVEYLDSKIVDGGGYTRFCKGDILFAKITPCTENGKVAMIQKMNTDVGFASTEFIVFQPKETVDNQFYFYLLSSDRVHKLAVSLMEGTTGRQRVPWKVFKNRISAPIPIDMGEQRDIAERIKKIEKSIVFRKSKILSLKTLKKSLMQNLLVGAIRVEVEKINKLLEEVEFNG